jgi:CHAD domain-containing protein/adenylate cyclase class IV
MTDNEATMPIEPGSTAPADDDAPLEVELKYRMTDVSAGERLLGADDLAGFSALGPTDTVQHEDRYVDTATRSLAEAGYAGRLRTSGDDTVITLKGLRRHDDGGAAHRREELEGPADLAADIVDWPASAARDALLAIAGSGLLSELVRIRQQRRKRLYAKDGTVVEVSVDGVEVAQGDTVIERFAELELELREGDEDALDALADLLSEVEELVPADTSKFERALEAVARREALAEHGEAEDTDEGEDEAAAGGDAPHGAEAAPEPGADVAAEAAPKPGADEAAEAAPKAPRIVAPKNPGVLAEDHLAEAGRKVLRFHLARMLAREEGTRLGKDPEELHAMRVATRRQRAAWRVFGDAFDAERTNKHRRRLKLVAADLGAVRDLDVLIEAAELYQGGLAGPEARAFDALIQGWRVRRDASRIVLLKELDSGRYRKWVDQYVDFLQTEGQGVRPVSAVQPHRVRDTMPSHIWAAYEGVRAYENVMRWADVTTLHELRIAAKWLRYTLEFAREALGRESGPVIEKVVALQDHLGWLHDADVAAGLARQFLVEHAGRLSEAESEAIGRYLVDRERELARLRRTVGPVWRGVSSVVFRRALGRVVAGL